MKDEEGRRSAGLSVCWLARASTRRCKELGGDRHTTAEIEGLLGIQNLHRQGWLGIAFLCRHVEGDPVPDGIETDKADYFSLEDIDAFGGPFEPWCEWLARRVLRGEHTVIVSEPNNPYHPRGAFL